MTNHANLRIFPKVGASLQARYFVQRHWRGELPIWLSLCGLGGLSVVADYALSKIIAAHLLQTYDPYIWLAGLFALSSSRILIWGWWCVGTYKSAKRASPKSNFFRKAILVGIKLLVVVVAMRLFHSEILSVVPAFRDATSNLQEDPQWGSRSVTISSSGAEFVIQGALTRSLVPKLDALIKENPTIKAVVLDSQGGRAGAAIGLRRLIEQSNLVTIVDHECISACTIVLLGGQERWKTSRAKIGFHGSVIGGMRASAADKVAGEFIQRAGASDGFIQRALETPPTEIWFPDNDELLANHIVTSIKK